MASWTDEDLQRIGDAEEVQIAVRRPDGSLRRPVIVWLIRYGDRLFVRSVKGTAGAWYRGVVHTHRGTVSAGNSTHEVQFREPPGLEGEVDAAYRSKYSHYPSAVRSITSAAACATTLEVLPADEQ